MCTQCGWQVALRNLAKLRYWRLSPMASWIETRGHVTLPQWKAIRKVAVHRDIDIEIPNLPELIEPDIEYLRGLPEIVDEGDNMEF